MAMAKVSMILQQRWRSLWMRVVPTGLALGLAGLSGPLATAQAQQLNAYCQIPQEAALAKESLRRAAFSGDQTAQRNYEAIVRQHSALVRDCRGRTWPNQQGVWVRLYPCDLQPGILEAVLDRMVNLGYNQVFVEVFYGGQVLLPKAANPTVWPSVVEAPGYEQRDLLAEAIAKGRQRGLEVQSWMFTLNYGYSYAQRTDRQGVLARNGQGQNTLTVAKGGNTNPDEVFVDPYHPQAQQDYRRLLDAVMQRRPDGIVFDYIRYPRGLGASSVAAKVSDLWIYGEASRSAFFQRALNNKGLELMRRFISQGYLTDADVEAADELFPNEGEPLWQTRVPSPVPEDGPLPASVRRPLLQNELWRLSVAHAVQGVVDFLGQVTQPVQRQGIQAGAVFFPNGNQTVGSGGYDSRLQYWDRFSTSLKWHPMAYAVCGRTDCIVDEVRRVLNSAGPSGPQIVQPVLAGIWGQPTYNRPALEDQMRAIRQAMPQINSLSHFAYSWQDPEFDRVRKFCQLR